MKVSLNEGVNHLNTIQYITNFQDCCPLKDVLDLLLHIPAVNYNFHKTPRSGNKSHESHVGDIDEHDS
jgi:hypothetical protein